MVASSGAVLLQREIPDAVSLHAASLARAQGVPVLMDAGGRDEPLPAELARSLDVLSPNETELHRLTGLPTGSLTDIDIAGRWLLRQGVGAVLVKLGARGCLLIEPENTYEQAAFPVGVVDTTGAGDCFTAAYTVALMEGMPAPRRLAFACAAAALCVQTKGALPSMPQRGAVERFLRLQVPARAPSMLPRLSLIGQLMMRPGLRIGLREWAVSRATPLSEGRSCLLVRKGGIHEPQGGLFRPEHERFVLLPTFLHQAADRLRPAYAGAYLQEVVSNPMPARIQVRAWAQVAETWRVTSLDGLRLLGDELPWSEAELEARLAYRGQRWLFVLALRVHLLPAAMPLTDHPSYGGCRSWVPLVESVPTPGSQAVIPEALWSGRLGQLRAALGTGSLPAGSPA